MAGDAPSTAHQSEARPGAPSATARLALYRRYRPATFAEVKGQEHVTEPLQQALRNGRIHHAYLFSGPRGCGKTSSARILARSLNCVEGPTPDPCGKCESCVALAPSGPGSIDVIEIDAASHGGVDDARDLRERAVYAPVSGRFRVYIIDEAHMVTREGFNALLKLVEEPPPHLKFVFATTEPEKVIATIRSRTHHYPFRLVPPPVLRELLEDILAAEGASYQPEVLPLVVRAGAGSVRDSLSVLDQLLAGAGEDGLTYERTVALLGYTDDRLLDEIVHAFSAGDGAAVFGAVDRVVQGGHDPRRFAADLLDRLRDLIILAAVPGAGKTGLLDAPADRLDRMAEQAGQFGQAELARAAEILSEGLIQMRGTASPRLLLELMCAQVLLPGAGLGERSLLARLERLERRLEAAAPEPAPATARPTAAHPPDPAARRPGTIPHPPSPAARRPSPAAQRPGAVSRPPGSAGLTPEPSDSTPESDTRGSRPDPHGSGSAAPPPVPDQLPPGSEPQPPRGRRDAGIRGDMGEPRNAEDRGNTEEREDAGERRNSAERRDAEDRGDTGDRGDAGADSAAFSQEKPARPAGARVASQPKGPAAPGRPRSSPLAGAGLADPDTLRQRWPEILDAVRGERKVAWLLLRGASVHSLENGLLTLAFPREGEAKGFSASGHDQVLVSVLGTLLGLNVRVRATVGPEPPAGRADAPGPDGPARRHGGGAHKPETGPDARAGGPASPARTRENSPRGTGPSAPPGRPQAPAPGAKDSASQPPAHEASRRDRSETASGGLDAKRLAASHPPSPPRSSAFADEEWPDEAAGPADPGGPGGPGALTGMELIQRQLGGRIIEEIEEG